MQFSIIVEVREGISQQSFIAFNDRKQFFFQFSHSHFAETKTSFLAHLKNPEQAHDHEQLKDDPHHLTVESGGRGGGSSAAGVAGAGPNTDEKRVSGLEEEDEVDQEQDGDGTMEVNHLLTMTIQIT